jgi:hypothetical protein
MGAYEDYLDLPESKLRSEVGLPDREARYYRDLQEYGNTDDFDDLTLEDLEELVIESTHLSNSKVKFPTKDKRLIHSLFEWMGDYAREYGEGARVKPISEWTFGYVARKMKIWFLIDIENGNYKGG